MRCVPARDFTVAKALAWRSAIDDDPPYQREGTVWSLEKRQRFIDSLLNGYDVPKIYLHDLRGKHPTKVYAVVDGKQRLTAIWGFLTDGFALADDFRIEPANLPELPPGTPHPLAGQHFSELHPRWREELRQTYLAVVLIQNATVEDIEDLFARLNNGEPLNAAEKRNAMGGDMAALVREVAAEPFFGERLRYPNARYRHYALATRILLVEGAGPAGDGLPDLRNPALDRFVAEFRTFPPRDRSRLLHRVRDGLDLMTRVFEPHDPLLDRPSESLLLYLFVREVVRSRPADAAGLRAFLVEFERRRAEAGDGDGRPGGPERAALVEFSHLAQVAPHDPRNLARRLAILRQASAAMLRDRAADA